MVQQYGVLVVALIVFASQIGVPIGIPVEIVLLLVGSFAIQSFPMLLAAIVLVTVADLLGALALYLTVRTAGTKLVAWLLRRRGVEPEEVLEHWCQRLGGRDVLVVLVVRTLPLIRIYASIGSGLLRIRPRDFLLGATPAGLVWVGTPLTLGYLLRSDVRQFAAQYEAVSFAIVIALFVVGLMTAIAGWRRQNGSGRAKEFHRHSPLGAPVGGRDYGPSGRDSLGE